MTIDDRLPAHLEQLGVQLTAAAHDLYGSRTADRRRRQPRSRRAWGAITRAPRLALATVGGLAAAVATTIVVATTGAPPAYALTANSNGSYTLTINDIATAVPEVNAEFAKLGLNAKAIPVTATCTAAQSAGWPLMGPEQSATMSETITLDNANIPAGSTAIVAAEQTPSGVRLDLGTDAASPLPTCLNSNAPAPVITPGS